MNIINVSVAELIKQQQTEYCVVPIGNEGEHGVTQVVIDCTSFVATYGEGIAQLLHQRNGDEIPYIVTISQENNRIIWNVTSDDTARDGFGKLQLNWYVSGNLAKSCIIRTIVKKALTDATLIPEEVESALELLTETVASKNPLLVAGANITLADNQDGTQTISASGGGGGSYTAGDGIDIINGEISVDADSDMFYFGGPNNKELALAYAVLIEDIDPETGQEELRVPFEATDPNRPMSAGYLASIFDSLRVHINDKQDKLTAGDGITISNNDTIACDFAPLDVDTNFPNVSKPIKATDFNTYMFSVRAIIGDAIDGKIAKTAVKQVTGSSTSDLMSQKAVTDALATKQASGDYATNTALTNGLATKQNTLPTGSDGDFLRSRNGVWVAESLASAESEAF